MSIINDSCCAFFQSIHYIIMMTMMTNPWLLLLAAISTTCIICDAFVPSIGSNNPHRMVVGKTSHGMFTGIIEEMGTVVSLEERDDMLLWDGSKGKGTELVVEGKVVMEGAYLG
jgi:hypothetical protein